jgi:glycosyltransferase involved in cell wall biosynthesis
MKISIVTPCHCEVGRLGETMDSVLGQRGVLEGRVKLDYIVVDGASTDGTADLARSRGAEVICEPDRGLYDALAKGLGRVTGDVVAYLNAGDVYHPTAFDVVSEIFESPEVQWLTGFRVGINEQSQVTDVRCQRPFRSEFFENGAYSGDPLPTIHQESTFWRSSLHSVVDLKRLAEFRLAGDFYLWHCFSRIAKPASVDAFLGAHRIHRGQLSEDKLSYLAEVRTICRPPTQSERITAWADSGTGGRLARWLNRVAGLPRMQGEAFFFDHSIQRWRVFD